MDVLNRAAARIQPLLAGAHQAQSTLAEEEGTAALTVVGPSEAGSNPQHRALLPQ